jgi:hypothetical protein
MSHQGNNLAAQRGNYAIGRGGNYPTGHYLTRAKRCPPPEEGSPTEKTARNQGPKPFRWGDSTFMVPQKIGPNATQNKRSNSSS